jgi:hypothetical protein
MSVEQGVRLFREAWLGTGCDVSLKARHSLRAGHRPQCRNSLVLFINSLRTFHDTLLGNGTAPFWLHRQLMLGTGDTGDLLE